MKTIKSNRSLQRFGVSAVAVSAILFSGTQVGAANDKEFGNQLLYKGKAHDHIIELKEHLGESDFLEKDEDENEWNNEYDEATKEAVKEFQEKYDLLVDGLAGLQTASALIGLEKGDESDLVLALQEDLAELGYYEYRLDGKFEDLTEEALINFQNDEEVEDDEGVAGPYTYSALHDMTSRYNPDIQPPETEETSQSNESNSNGSNQADNSSQPESTSSENESAEESSSSNNEPEASMTLEATAYTAYCDGCSGVTYTGIDLRSNPNKKVVAVDPNVIPLGSIVEVEGYGRAVAGDIGGAIKGNRIDLHVPTKDEAFSFGRRNVEVTIVETP
ncbi:peptidoglycan-binding protein [Salipaludibacillus sp. HK11]|uniref:peptidoglycan-binding protein n=1 Tax=Salipaludibacillus sp. HK11 TaxID=3394320 RepID=UPI0039FCB3A6